MDSSLPAAPARWVRVCTLGDSAARPILPFWMGGRHYILVRDGNDFFACERACPHEQADLAKGHCSAGKLFCPRHLASFDLTSGQISAQWPSRPLLRHPVRVVNEEVLVAGDPLPHAAASGVV